MVHLKVKAISGSLLDIFASYLRDIYLWTYYLIISLTARIPVPQPCAPPKTTNKNTEKRTIQKGKSSSTKLVLFSHKSVDVPPHNPQKTSMAFCLPRDSLDFLTLVLGLVLLRKPWSHQSHHLQLRVSAFTNSVRIFTSCWWNKWRCTSY